MNQAAGSEVPAGSLNGGGSPALGASLPATLSSRHALNLVCLSLGFKWSLQEQLAFSGPGLLFRAVERSGLF